MTVAHAGRHLPARRTPAHTLQATNFTTATSAVGTIGKPRTNNRRVRVLLADAKPMIRGALVALLSREPDIEVVAELTSGDAVLAEARRVRPDVAVLDLGLLTDNNLATVRVLKSQMPSCQTIILANMATPRALRMAIDAEVRGFVVKDAPPSVLAESIRRIAAGEYVIDSSLASRALANPDGPLTERQREVLETAAEGASVPEIASRLCLSAGTVRNYLSASIAKLGARNRVDAIRIAQDAGWI